MGDRTDTAGPGPAPGATGRFPTGCPALFGPIVPVAAPTRIVSAGYDAATGVATILTGASASGISFSEGMLPRLAIPLGGLATRGAHAMRCASRVRKDPSRSARAHMARAGRAERAAWTQIEDRRRP